MALIPLGKVEEEKPAATASSTGLIPLGETAAPGMGEVLEGVLPRAGLSIIGTGAGVTRAVSDFFGFDTLADNAAEVARNAAGAAADTMPAGANVVQRGISSGLESGLTMVPAVLTGSAPVMAATGAAQTFGPRYTELRDKGFSGGRSTLVAGIDAVAEFAGEYGPAKFLMLSPFKRGEITQKLFGYLARDLGGEEATYAMQQLNGMLNDNPELTVGQFLEGALQTAIAVPFGGGVQAGARLTQDALKGNLAQPAGTPAPAPGGETSPVAPGAPTSPGTAETIIEPSPPASPAPTAEPEEATPPSDIKPAPTQPTNPAEWMPGVGVDGVQFYTLEAPGLALQARPNPNGGWVLDSGYGPIAEASDEHGIFEQAAEMGYATPLTPDWKWSPSGDRLQYVPAMRPDGRDSEYHIFGRKNVWELVDFNGQVKDTFIGDLTNALPKFESGIKGTPAPIVPENRTPAPPTSSSNPILQALVGAAKPLNTPPSAPPPFLNMLKHTAEEMMLAGSYDPRLYIGAVGQGRDIHPRYESQTGKFDLGQGPSLSVQDALDELANILPFDVRNTDLGNLERIHTSAVLNQIIARPDLIREVSPNIAAKFGGKLEQIAQHMKERVARNISTIPFYDALAGYQLKTDSPRRIRVAGDLQSVTGKSAPKFSAEDIYKKQPGVYIDPRLPPQFRRVGAFVETIRKRYAPHARVAIIPRLGAGVGEGGLGHIGQDTYILGVGGGEKIDLTKLDVGKTLVAMAHEMGHLVIFEHFHNAGPQTKASLLLSWLEYTSAVTQDKALGQYMAEHHWDARDIKPGTTIAQGHKRNTQYFMSPSEYFADQAAHHFLMRDASGFTGLIKQWFDALLQHLESMFKLHNAGAFKRDKVFVNWLESLANREKKAGAQMGTPSRDSPGIKATDIKPGKNPLANVEQAEALIIRMTNMLDLLSEAGASAAEIEALTLTQSVKDFPFDQARQLLIKYGVPPWRYRDTYRPGDVDDTLSFRENLFNLNSNGKDLFDKDRRLWIGESSSAIKAFGWFLQKTITAVQLRKRYGDQVPGVRMFVDTLEKMFANRASWKERADDRLKFVQTLSEKDRTKVFEILLEEDKSEEYQSVITQDALGRRVFSIKPEVLQRHGFTGQQAEMAAKLYGDMRADFDAVLSEMENEFVAELERTYGAGTPALLKAVAELKDAFVKMKAKPYVPHTRFGEHTISVRDAQGKLQEFYQAESASDARKIEEQLRREKGEGLTVSRGKLTEQQRMMMGMPPQLVNAMKAHLNMTPQQIAVFEDTLKDMTHGASFVRRFKRRKNLVGWVDDAERMPRAYADYMSRAANHLSRLKFNHVLTGAVGEVRKQGKEFAAAGANTVELDELGNWLGRLHTYVNEPGQEFTMARAAATLWYLGFNIKSALVNATSVPLVSFPYLSARYGEARATAALAQAYRDIGKKHVRLQSLTDDEKKFLQHMRDIGINDQSFASELAAVREGGRLSDEVALSEGGATFYKLRYYGMWMFQRMEVVNREVTSLAAYRLARTVRNFSEGDMDGFDRGAMEFAKSTVQDTQNENAQWNRSQFMRGQKGILTLFMSYQQNLLYQMLGGDPAWWRLLSAQFVAAGLMGLPFAQDLSDAIKAISRKVLGKDFSPELAARQLVVDFAGPKADWIMKGVTHNLGGLNLQGSISQGRVIPGVEALAMHGKFADNFANAAGDVGGAGISIIMNIMRAINSNNPDMTIRAQQMLPEFLRSMAEGGRMLYSGEARDLAGNKLTDIDAPHAVGRMLGFQSTDVSKERAKRFAQKDAAAYWNTRRQAVFNLFELATDSGDSAWMEKAQKALREFNEEAPDYGLRINGKQLRSSLRSRQRSDQRTEQGLGPSRTTQGLYGKIEKLYPTE
jgi:hypothetical protein